MQNVAAAKYITLMKLFNMAVTQCIKSEVMDVWFFAIHASASANGFWQDWNSMSREQNLAR